jgi:hypothetical protein
MKCPNFHGKEINSDRSKPLKFIGYFFGICMLLGAAVNVLQNPSFTDFFIYLFAGIGFIFLGNRLGVISYYCTTCEKKWHSSRFGF